MASYRLLLILTLLMHTNIFAHFGGDHYANAFQQIWENTQNKEKFKGTYLYATEKMVYIETNNGRLKEIPLHSLTATAKHLVALEQQRIMVLNQQQFARFNKRQIGKVENNTNQHKLL